MAREKKYKTDYQGVHYIVPTDSANGRRAEAESSSRAEMGTIRRTRTEASSRADDQWTVARLWDEYQTANPALKGMSVYRAIFNAHLSRSFGGMQPAEIAPFDLDRLKLDEMKGRSPKSIANALELLRRLVCVLDHHLEAGSSRMAGAAMMKLALFTGMRRGEIFRLKWSDLDFHRNNILLREPKGGRDVIIPMSSHTRRLLESLERFRHDSKSGSDENLRNRGSFASDYVFPGRGGRQRRDVRKQVNAIKVEAGLPEDFRPLHGLRHVFASGLVSSGVEFQIVQRLLTHKGGTVTHRYAHIRDDALRAAAELAGDLVEQVTRAAAGGFPSQRE